MPLYLCHYTHIATDLFRFLLFYRLNLIDHSNLPIRFVLGKLFILAIFLL
jgi:hypothetical protein